MKFLVAIILIAATAPFASSSSDPCAGPAPALGIIQITAGSADTTYYVDDRNYATGNGIWTYAETNGVWTQKSPGVYFGDSDHKDLQRGLGAYVPLTPDFVEEICTDDPTIAPDSAIT